MKIKVVTLGDNNTNCYIITEGNECIIVDPGDHPDLLLEIIQKENLEVKYIINTHGHFDHILGNNELKEKTNGNLTIHKNDSEMIQNPFKNLSAYILSTPFYSLPPDIELNDGDEIKIGNKKLLTIHTPGHTKGSSCFYIEDEKILLTGDTLFKFSYGRTDFIDGNQEEIINSLKRLYNEIPDEVTCLPGHGEIFKMSEIKEWLKSVIY
jgi:glyoxylase-like metal-dependent hydrolase (beta-lactamase superfamily II)